MGFFGSSSGDTSGSSASSPSSSDALDLSSYEGGTTKLRSPSSSYSSNFEETGDLQSFVQVEQQKQQIMEQCHKLNDVCWKMCVSSVSSSLGSRTETCLTNCTERFVDTTLLITNRFAQLASKMQGH